MTLSSDGSRIPSPPCRRLRAFAIDPSLSRRSATADINEVVLKIPWDESLGIGPVDEYIEVVDVDPASGSFYAPVDLNQRDLLAQDGVPPSESNPQFHQQMVYAVARTTIRHFEQALGRRALWSPHLSPEGDGRQDEFVARLRIYPHALREANAYYSPDKKALLLGYFPAAVTDPRGNLLPGGVVFTCLSHDVVAHETTHALLDGLHRRFIEPTNPDVWALHEAFADIVALLQHFSNPEVLRHQIALTGGDLERQNMLGQLAQEVGQAIGRYGALRDAIGEYNPRTGVWQPKEPDPDEIHRTWEPHARGAILVAAVFDAFLTVYRRRIADLLRIATGGSGVLPPGELHPDLVNRLAEEAATTAQHLLQMCIRALDYCPPVDVTFGDYLRALITGDAGLVTDDPLHYRLAVIEAFRRRGIYPRDVRSLSLESLLWETPTPEQHQAFREVLRGPGTLRRLVPDWGLTSDRRTIYNAALKSQTRMHALLADPRKRLAAEKAFLVVDPNAPPTYYRPRWQRGGPPAIEVHSVRPARRIGPEGQTVTELVVVITQRRRGYYDPDQQKEADSGALHPLPPPDFIFRGGCTLLVDPETAEVKYCVFKRIESPNRLERQRSFLCEELQPSLQATYLGDARQLFFERLHGESSGEPLALLHRSYGQEEVV